MPSQQSYCKTVWVADKILVILSDSDMTLNICHACFGLEPTVRTGIQPLEVIQLPMHRLHCIMFNSAKSTSHCTIGIRVYDIAEMIMQNAD